jgi:hypothetical protein
VRVVRLLASLPVADNGSVATDGAPPRQQAQRDRRRAGTGLAFSLWQCDKKNHGWREGLPLDRTLPGYGFVGRPSPSRQISPNEKRLLRSDASRPRLYGLAGIKRLIGSDGPIAVSWECDTGRAADAQTAGVDQRIDRRFPVLIHRSPHCNHCLYGA